LHGQRLRRRAPSRCRGGLGPGADGDLERARRRGEVFADARGGHAVHAVLPADVIEPVRGDLVTLGGDLTQEVRRARTDGPGRQQRSRQHGPHAVEPEGARAPHLPDEARSPRAPEREPGTIGAHGDEERRADTGGAERVEQPRHALVEATAGIDVDAQG
jgi:hypothetical protein